MEPVVWDTAPKPKTCEKCGQPFPSHCAFYAHRKTCKETFPCGQCAERLESKIKLKEHLKLHSHGHLICGLCDRPPFRSQTALDDHRHGEHGVELKCPCGKTFTRAEYLGRHMKACVVTGPSLLCGQCDMPPFRSQVALDDLRHTEHGVELKCPCGKAFTRADNLVRHMKACTAWGPSLVCACGAASQTMDQFREHQAGCIMSPLGALKAVKRRFDEVVDGLGEDRVGAMRQAGCDTVAAVRAKRARTCTKCGGGFANARSMERHQLKMGHRD